jgi:hypothetical protein
MYRPQERLEREYDLDLITTAPTVVFKAITNQGVEIIVDCPSKLPEANRLDSISEPYVRCACGPCVEALVWWLGWLGLWGLELVGQSLLESRDWRLPAPPHPEPHPACGL